MQAGDRGAGRDADVVGEIEADDPRTDAERRGGEHHRAEPVGEDSRGRRGPDKRRDGQQRPEALGRDQDGGGEQDQDGHVSHGRRRAERSRRRPVESTVSRRQWSTSRLIATATARPAGS